MSRLPEGMTSTESEVSQTIDLVDLFGEAIADRPRVRQEFGQALVDKMLERTESGKARGGKDRLDKYSPEYIASEDFKEFDKSPSKVNMTLTGNMLDSIDFEDDETSLTVSVADDQAPKANNHNRGITVPKRAFFGFTQKEIRDVAAEFKQDIKQEEQPSEGIDLGAVLAARQVTPEQAFSELFEEFGVQFEG